MGWNNPPVRLAELERTLSGRSNRGGQAGADQAGDGNDSPAWTCERYVRPRGIERMGPTDSPDGDSRVPYAELHCHSNFSFLDGASHPEELVETAAELELDAIAITDHDGMYGVVRFAEAAKELGVRTVFGTELSLGLPEPQNGVADPVGEHLLLLATDSDGYARLCRTITSGQLAGYSERNDGMPAEQIPATELACKGRPVYDIEAVAADVAGRAVVLTGCRKGAVRRALVEWGPEAAIGELRRLVVLFGADHLFVELIDHGLPTDTVHNDLLAAMADELGLPTVASTAAHYAWPSRGRLA
ncbi:MAG: PHP domain-containing protein, partial [Sciscionella sp.]